MGFIDGSGLAGQIDRDASNWTAESLHRTFLTHGCVVVRGVIPIDALESLRDVIAREYTKTTDLHIYDTDIKAATDGTRSGFELVDVPLLQEFLGRVYEGQNWRQHSVNARRIEGVDSIEGWQKPLELHLDCQFHQFEFTTNFWIPLQHCGVESPAVQFLPIDYRRTRQYSGYTGALLREGERWNFGYFPDVVCDPDVVTKDFGPECLFHPVMNPGDAIIASNWIIHGSYRTPNMRKGRTNVEIRFIGSQLDLNPVADPEPRVS